MNALTYDTKTQTNSNDFAISSREIAVICKKRHDHVVRDIEKMLIELGFNLPNFGDIYFDAKNREQKQYLLPKDLATTLGLGYSIKLRYRLVKYIEKLEGQNNKNSLPDFEIPKTFSGALRLAADAMERADKAEQTKAEIGSRREATAMNTASQVTKKANKLEQELDRSSRYATVKRMAATHEGIKFNWRELKRVSQGLNCPPIDVFDANYGTVKAYHADVWREVYALDVPQFKDAA